jgi:hypothetical protein
MPIILSSQSSDVQTALRLKAVAEHQTGQTLTDAEARAWLIELVRAHIEQLVQGVEREMASTDPVVLVDT